MTRNNEFILGATRYQVTAPAVVAKLITGAEAHVYQGGILPSSTTSTQVQHLLDLGMIEPLGGAQ